MTNDVKLFAGNSNSSLAKHIAYYLKTPLSKADVTQFSDGEVRVEIMEHVRGKDVFVIQSTSAPTNDNLMELLTMCDALRRSSANRIIAVVPYFGYARQDRRPGTARVPITAKLVASMLETAGVDHVITLDIHAAQIQGFFNIPIDNITAIPVFVGDIVNKWMTNQRNENVIVVSPDVGGVARARSVAKYLNADLAIVDKRRPSANVSEVMNIVGNVEGKVCVLVDDIVDTAGTLCKASDALIKNGAKTVVAYATHGVLSGKAFENIRSTNSLRKVIVTDTIFHKEFKDPSNKVRVVSVAGFLAESINRVHTNESISSISFD